MGSRIGIIKIAAGRRGLTVDEYQAHIDGGLKWCSKCKQWHRIQDFHMDASRGDGLSTRCRECSRSGKSGKPYNPERRQMRELGFAWCRNCKDWITLSEMTNTGRCRAHHNAYMRARYATDEKYRLKWRRMVHDRKRRIDPIDAEEAKDLLDEFNGRCAYCGRTATTMDHIIPVSQGGHSRHTNLLPACASCNSSKGAQDALDWMATTGKLTDEAVGRAIFVTHVL